MDAPDRLALIVTLYLLAPTLIFSASWLAPAWAVVATGAGLAAMLTLARGWHAPWPVPARRAWICLALGLVWAVLASGTHHWLHAAADWQIRDAVLHDLAQAPWPVAYRSPEAEFVLRAPHGFYMPAALVGLAAGLAAAQAALFLWTALGLALVLMLLSALAGQLVPTRPRAWPLFALVFVLFGGLDILPNVILDMRAGAGPLAAWGRGGEWWNRIFQYSGHVTLVVWVPNHALPAWLCMLLVLRHGLRDAFARGLALPVAAAMFWTPLGALGAAALGVVGPLTRGLGWAIRAALSPANLLAVVVAVPVALYLTAGSGAIAHDWVFLRHGAANSLGRWTLLLLVEVLPWALGIALVLRPGALFAVSLALLAVLPAYVFGPGNEMTMRTGIAPLTVLAVLAASAMLAPALSRAARWGRRILAAALVLAAIGQAMEASLLVAHRPWAPSRDCSVPEAASQSAYSDSTDWSHYLVRWPEPWMEALLRRPSFRQLDGGASQRCWTGG